MHPCIAHFYALAADVRLRVGDFNLLHMRTAFSQESSF
jgi:hypothetical protein